jgi:hypothetical protein
MVMMTAAGHCRRPARYDTSLPATLIFSLPRGTRDDLLKRTVRQIPSDAHAVIRRTPDATIRQSWPPHRPTREPVYDVMTEAA